MLKKLTVITTLLFLLSTYQAKAAVLTKPTRENLLEDAVNQFLYPYMKEAVQQKFGASEQMNKGIWCERIINVKKPTGSENFEIAAEFSTFSGAHNPPHHVFTITVDNDLYGWHLTKTKAIIQPKNYQCRNPVLRK